MLLEINPLVLPDPGLLIWSTLAFLILLFVLGKFAWKPIMKAIGEREKGINDAIASAEKVKAEMAQLQSDNEKLLAQAREERTQILNEAKAIKDKMISEAKEQAKAEAAKIMAETQQAIENQKMAAVVDLKNQVGNLVIEVSEKVLRRELSNKAQQETYIKELANDIKLN
ncbi:MAG: F0F1 ATP synthase subunit B [Terrimonas sp.]|mgnify:CR=1 FL=1|uniref:F0F1 ATP synthase subunit B n=1 Tax=Terrimonas sp. TaxID=1914338 RepID=UPI00092BC444|nr:F0F1 ATP synthase subunit B [Terrimonas sp.]MBN8788729.1 F0F1 ATP synthase subunit B [Terrimonas sp.]OJY86310.1 MAG: ATP synthase F0 subunit B [Sphingobacteriales bacterium 40-81]PVD54033.1 ATP synthase F0 subunit B [Terrimonas sp.]